MDTTKKQNMEIEHLRRRHGLTYQDMADRADCSVGHIFKILHGRVTPGHRLQLRLNTIRRGLQRRKVPA